MQRTDTVVVGAGQAGLSTSRLLADAGRDHVVLERGRVGERWRSERWDSLRLLTPNWMTRLPQHDYDGDDPDGYMTAAALAARFDDYARSFEAPVAEGVDVRSVRAAATGEYVVETSAGGWRAANVVVATGWFADPVVPPFAAALDQRIHQLHAGQYRDPSSLPDGGVLVVGASASGVQLADELARSGRRVRVAAGSHVRLPRRYRGRDVLWWLDRAGVLDDRPDGRPQHALRQPSLQLVGRPTDLDLGVLAGDGVEIAGRLLGVDGTRAYFGDDLADVVADADRRLHRVLDRIDSCARHTTAIAAARPAPLRLPPAPTHVDLRAEGITSVLWATGHRPSFPWLHVPVLDGAGAIRHRGGVTPVPGLYAVGMRWQSTRRSTYIDGARHDAAAVVDHLRGRRPAAAA